MTMSGRQPSASYASTGGRAPAEVRMGEEGTSFDSATSPSFGLRRICSLIADCLDASAVVIRDSVSFQVLVAHGLKRLDGTGHELLREELQDPLGTCIGTLEVVGPALIGPRAKRILQSFAHLVESELARAPEDDPALGDLKCPTTGLLTRAVAFRRMDGLLERAASQNFEVALVIADIADFNAINSAFGRSVGDFILGQAAERLQKIAPREALSFRLQGDQFGIVLSVQDRGVEIESLISSLATGFEAPIRVQDRDVVLHLVFGTAVYPHRAGSASELLDRALIALRRAQDQRSGAEIFTTELEARLVREVAVEQRLRTALSERALTVAYQPKISLASGEIRSMEALARWTDAELNFVSPAEFIPAAERAGLIVDLGQQVLETALEDVMKVRVEQPTFSVSVNVAAAQLLRDDFVSGVLAALKRASAPADALELEVVETSLIEDIDRAASIIEALQSHGVAFSIDDFGTGYSSLAYLRRLPVHTLKIDRDFVRVITQSERDTALVHSIISMAHVLGFEVVAEGVETETQAKILRELGCDAGQGYLWAKPSPIEELIAQLEQHQPLLP